MHGNQKLVDLRVIRDILWVRFGVDPESVSPSSDLREDFGLDLIDLIELVIELKSRFDDAVLPEDVESIRCVRQLLPP